MNAVEEAQLSLREASETMGVSYRQAKRIWRRFQTQGDAGLVHRARGRPGTRRKPPTQRRQIVRRYQQRYPDFGPTLAAEYLAKEGLVVDHETLRRWLLQEGLRTVGRARRKHRQWRERKPCLGQMVQLDGSHHDWFEGRRDPAVLMVMIDDATNRTCARFSEQETTEASYDIFAAWTERYGLPLSLYVDRDSIYRTERLATVAEQVAGEEPQTQFGRAMSTLGVEVIWAYSPQAKGRVERRNGVLQDRLVKALRLAGISDLGQANRFLDQEFLPDLNRRFRVQPSHPGDVHQKAPRGWKQQLNWEDTRVVRKDWTVCWAGRWFQIDRQHEPLGLAARSIVVRRLRDGTIQLLDQGRQLRWKELPHRPVAVKAPPRRIGRTRVVKPAPEHPWRQFGGAVGQRFWSQIRKHRRPR